MGSRLNGIQEARGSNLKTHELLKRLILKISILDYHVIIDKINMWGRGEVGIASEWHSEGREFESHRLHHKKEPYSL